MRRIEFQTRPNGDVEVIPEDGIPYILNETSRELISELYDKIRMEFPEAFASLSSIYKKSIENKRYFEFLLVRRFIKCNWSAYDDKSDITTSGDFEFEFCSCPMRGECPDWNIICRPKKTSILTPAEINVLRLIAAGSENNQIANELYISKNTVHNHRNNILKKLNLHNTAQLTDYWHKNNFK
jgi:DNA-binding CsgD family transcriptional regulator